MKNFKNLGTPLSKSELQSIKGQSVSCLEWVGSGIDRPVVTTFSGTAAEELHWLEACHRAGGFGRVD